MERAEGLLGGKFLFKRQNDRTIDKTKVVCSICQAECSYHLNAKHPTESTPRLDDRFTVEYIATVTQESFESQYYITRALFGTRSLFAMTAPLVNMSKTGYEKICLCCLSSWSFTHNIHKNFTFSLK